MRTQAKPRIQSIQARREGAAMVVVVMEWAGSVEGAETSKSPRYVERADVSMGHPRDLSCDY